MTGDEREPVTVAVEIGTIFAALNALSTKAELWRNTMKRNGHGDVPWDDNPFWQERRKLESALWSRD